MGSAPKGSKKDKQKGKKRAGISKADIGTPTNFQVGASHNFGCDQNVCLRQQAYYYSRPTLNLCVLPPLALQHVGHLGFDGSDGVGGLGGDEASWKELLDKAGLTEEDIKDPAVRSFVQDFVKSAGGLPPGETLQDCCQTPLIFRS